MHHRPKKFHEFFIFLAAVALLLTHPHPLLAHGDVHERIINLTAQIEQDSNNPALYLKRAELHREHQDWPAAQADCDHAAQLDPKLAPIDFFRAKILVDQGQLPAARALFDKYLANQPTDGPAYIARARLLANLKERKAAAADFARGIELVREPQPEYFLEHAQVLAADGQTDEALRALDAGEKKLGAIVTLEIYALDLELARTNYPAALTRLDKITAQVPRKENWLARRGEIELLMGRPADAKKSYEAALAAISTLPPRFQQSEAMVDLRARINKALAGINITN